MMVTWGRGVKFKYVALWLTAYATSAGLVVSAQDPLEVPTTNQEGRELVVSDLQVERRLVVRDGDEFEIDIDALKPAFEALHTKLEPFSTGDPDKVLTNKIPFIGKSVTELVTDQSDNSGHGIDTVLNLAALLDTIKTPRLNLTDAQDVINELFADSSLTGNVKATGVCPAPIVLDGQNKTQTVLVTVCAELTFVRDVQLDAGGLFDALDGFAEIDLDLDFMLGVTAKVSFGASFTIDLGSSGLQGNITLEPVVVLLSGAASTNLVLAIGMLDLVSNASVMVDGEFKLTFCTNTTCDVVGEMLGSSPFYIDRDAGYNITGNLITTEAIIPGLTLPDGAGFAINELSVFEPDPDITFSGLGDIDLKSFLDFSPRNGVALLTRIDSALARAQENEAFDLNIPFTNMTFSRILATGSVVTSKLLELFVRPEPFEDRESKSLLLRATKTAKMSDDAVPEGGKRLDFYFLAQGLTTPPNILLTVNPDDQKDVRDISKVCKMTLNTNYTDDQNFAEDLIAGINDDTKVPNTCGIQACAALPDECITEGDITCSLTSTPACDVLIGVNNDGFVFIASMAYRNNVTRDVQLFGLYEPLETTNGPGSFFGFPLNQPTFPILVPRFRNLIAFTDLINDAIESRFTGVAIALQYYGANTTTAARFDIGIDFTVSGNANASFDGSAGVGDLIDISTVGDAILAVKADFNVSTVLAVVFEANDVEQLVLIGNACSEAENATFSCDLEAASFNLTIDTIDYPLVLEKQTNSSASDALNAAFAAAVNDTAVRPTVREVGANVLTITFNSTSSAVELVVLKTCTPLPAVPAKPPAILTCPDGESTYNVSNSYGLTDDTISKRPFQIAVGKTSIAASFEITGETTLVANVGGVIEVKAVLQAAFSGWLTLNLGMGGFLRFSEWLAALISIFNTDSDGYIAEFFTSTASFEGDLSAYISALAPFDFIPPIDANGAFAEPFEIDFLFIKNESLPEDEQVQRASPNITFEVDLPRIGGLRNLEFRDIIELLGQVLEFLVGAEVDQTPQSCSGGLLGMEIAGQAVFSYQVPILGLSACSSARFLQVFVDAVDDLSNGGNATFNSLEGKLEALLQDGVGGMPDVEMLTTYDNVTGIAELLLNITLAWNTTESTALNIDLTDLLDTSNETANIQRFIKEFVPAQGQAQLDVSGGMMVTLAVGIEYRSNTSEVLPFIIGATGLTVDIGASSAIEFEARIGPLGAEVRANVTVEGENKRPLSMRAGLDSRTSYYLREPMQGRPNFVYKSISDLLLELGVEFDGRVEAILIADVPLVGMKAEINVTVVSVDALFKGNNTSDNLITNIDFTPPSSPEFPSFIDILLADPNALVEGVDNVIGAAERASLGPTGIITNFPAPFISEKLGTALGANTKDNILAQARSAIIPKLKAQLEGFEGPKDTVADLLARVIEDVLVARPEDDFIGLIRENDTVTTTCFVYNNNTMKQVNYTCSNTAIEPTSIMWTIPFGQNFVVELPLDFKLDDDFPVEISLQGDDVPTLCIGWSFKLAFGYDETEGFFLYTFPDDTAHSEFEVEALLSVPNTNISANLFFLDVDLTNLNIDVGAKLFVDIDKSSALRKPDVPGPNFGRVTQGDFQKITQISDLFVIGAISGATLEVEKAEVSLDVVGLESVNSYIPRLNFGIAAHFRKEFDIKESASTRRLQHNGNRRLLHDANRRSIGRLHEGSDHRAFPLLRSLRKLESGADNTLTALNFNFSKCPADGVNTTACAVVTNVILEVDKIGALVKPIVEEFVNDEEDGVLDLIVNPLEPLRTPIPGVSEVTGKDVTILDVAEAFDRVGSGVDTVRKMFKIYDGLRELFEQLTDLEGIVLAEVCDVLDSFNCTGGLSDPSLSTRRLVDATYYDPFGRTVDAFGLPMTPRILSCKTMGFTAPECSDEISTSVCSGCSKRDQVKCKAGLLKCKVGAIEGLTFPILSDPISALGLLSGGDVRIMDFSPPEIVFAFSYEQFFVLYTPPTCTLTIGFEFSVRLRVGFVLDTKGIREAVGPPLDLIKAGNSLALKDLFDGVDEPLMIITASISVELAASAAIIKISAKGGITFVVTIDFYDPFPDTSGGLIRPFELLSLGGSPLQWFEIELSITLTLTISIEIGIYLGFLEITLYSYGVEFNVAIVPGLHFTPHGIPSVAELDVETGTMMIMENVLQGSKLECFSRSGDIGDEEIECVSGNLYRTYSGVKALCGGNNCLGNGSNSIASTAVALISSKTGLNATFDCIMSGIDIQNLGRIEMLTLSYLDCPAAVISGNKAYLSKEKVVAGIATTLFDQVSEARLVTPKPEIDFYTTVIGGDCNNTWVIKGHSNVEVQASKILSGCAIMAEGGFSNAKLTIDLGSDSSACAEKDNSTVVISTDTHGFIVATISPAHLSSNIKVKVGRNFTNIEIYGSQCNDKITLKNTFKNFRNVEETERLGSVYIEGRGGDDTITIGDPNGNGTDSIYKTLYLDGGEGDDSLNVDDSASTLSKTEGVLDGGSLLQILGGGVTGSNSSDLFYSNFQTISVYLSGGANEFEVTSTLEGSVTNVHAGDVDDIVTVKETQGDIFVYGGDGNDQFYFTGLGDNATATVYGGIGNDTLFVDGSAGLGVDVASVNTFDNSTLRWSGGPGNDLVDTVFTSNGTSNLDIFEDADDDTGVNDLMIRCSDFSSFILSRENFIANIHRMDDPSSSVERINIVRKINISEIPDDVTDGRIPISAFIPTARISRVFINLNDGNNSVFLDDTMAPITIYGGPKRDEFHIGQLYHSERGVGSHVNVADPITTTLTTQGYLSDGNNHPVVLNGEFGGDLFDVLRNKKVLDLNGGSGDDIFVVRSFVNLPIAENGTIMPPDVAGIKMAGGLDNDRFDVTGAERAGNVTVENFSAKEEDPDYLINSLVDIDGGPGTDTLVVVGTEFDDSYVITERAVYGGGLSIKFTNIEILEVSCEEGNDLVSVLSTSPNTQTNMYGSLGSDEFVITPRTVNPVSSKNLRGHRGILEHVISSEDPDYDMLLIQGVAVDVLDNDGEFGYINIVEFEAVHLLDEDGMVSFKFAVYPTRKPAVDTQVVIDIINPADKDATNYLTLNGSNLSVLPLNFTDTVVQYVEVRYDVNGDAVPLEITELNLLITISLNSATTDERFEVNTQQSILPVDVTLLPAIKNAQAKSVTVFQPTGRTVVVEGDKGFSATYNVFLRPCTDDMANQTTLSIAQSAADQVELSQTEIKGMGVDGWDVDGGCNVTITVNPSVDSVQEGDHFVSLSHVVTNATGDPVLLSDNSTLFASNVLVRIYDDDIGSVIIKETGAATSTAEMDESDKVSLNDTSLYEDEYKLRLTKQPSENVYIAVVSQPTSTDRPTLSTAGLQRNTAERIQAHVGTLQGPQDETVTIVFTNETWNTWQSIRVTAFNDNITEGVDLLWFPSQPSYLAFIQGPISLSGGGSALFPDIAEPLLLPGENDTDDFSSPNGSVVDQSSLFAIEEKQVDSLRIYNTDVRGNASSSGNFTNSQLVGLNMAKNIVINGQERLDGIEYSGMEVVEIYLGNGPDTFIVENTTRAIHLLDTGGGDDSVWIKDISGPFIVHGQNGSDVVDVTSNEMKLDRIEALLAFDGGRDEEVDTLNVNNSASDEDDILFVSRHMVEFENTMPEKSTNLPDSFLINLRNATVGTFFLEFTEDKWKSSITVTYPINASDLESLIQRALIPIKDEDSCGMNHTTKCSNAVKVYEIGQTFAVFFVGERLNNRLDVSLDVSNLTESFVPEVFQKITVDLLKRNSDIAYANLEVLNIKTGTGTALVNVRGTSAKTIITTQDKNDLVFISSEASQVNIETAASLEYLPGWLDYLENDFTVNVGIGRHRLLISDENSTVSKGVDITGPAELTKESLTNISYYLGDIFYTADGGNWCAGVNLWLGKGDDRLNVVSVPSNPGSTTVRTTTTVRAGPGEDTVNIALDETDHEGTLFVANGQADNDVIDASQSTLGLIIFGDGGDDQIMGGFGRDIVFGDFGRVVWKSETDAIFKRSITEDIFKKGKKGIGSGVFAAVAGGDGFGDFTDGVACDIFELFSVSAHFGGSDKLTLGSGDDVGIGGPFDDIIEGNGGRDILFGDSAEIRFHKESTSPKSLMSIHCKDGGSDILYGGPGDVNYLVGGSKGDEIYGSDGMDLAFGDHAYIELFEESHKLSFAKTIDAACSGGADIIELGPGDDLAFGGAMGDNIKGGEGQDVIFGDFGVYNAQVEYLPFQNYRPIIVFPDYAGDDTLDGGDNDDFIIGQEGNDSIDGGSGSDDIYGGHSIRHGRDVGDILKGGDHDDVILGDNGEIVRKRTYFAGDYPWINGVVWQTWPKPFNTEVIRDVRRYDDIDFVQGNDHIYGDDGNDILHGQRGDDYISGGSGEDEIYGELGSDTLDGDSGNDILLGDIGYIIRRLDSEGKPILISKTGAASSPTVWKKDIVLEELGRIEGVHRISQSVNTTDLLAENVTSSSLLFVANAFVANAFDEFKVGDKFLDENKTWLTDLLLFKLNSEPDDDIIDGGEGDDVCIGQRGDDTLQGGPGNDLLIGDAGTNVIAQNMDMPRIYQIYRTFYVPDGSGYDVHATDFGATFSADYELYPLQYRSVDYLSSITDLVVNVDDLQEKSNILNDIIGVSGLSVTAEEYCMQPMFRMTPGFLYETQIIHGNDTLVSGPDDSILIGDDIRGFTGLDLSTELSSALLGQVLDNLVVDLSVRMSTLEVDTEFFLNATGADSNIADFNITVADDDITTDEVGRHFVTGDSLTIIARSVRGGSLDQGNASETLEAIIERLYDIRQVFMQVHLAMYEVHHDLLKRASTGEVKLDSKSQHALFLANDRIDSRGDGDFVFGDSSTLFFQADRPDTVGFEFQEFTDVDSQRLREIARAREAELDDYVNNTLIPSSKLSDSELGDLLFDDVPFLLTVGSDTILMNAAANLGVGDFGMLGLTSSEKSIVQAKDLTDYAGSIQKLRTYPSVSSVNFQLRLPYVADQQMSFYYARYNSTVLKMVKAKRRADTFYATSADSTILGEFFTGFAYGQNGAELNDSFLMNTSASAFDPACLPNGRRLLANKDELRSRRRRESRNLQFSDGDRCISTFDGDHFDIVTGTAVDGQLGQDDFVIDQVPDKSGSQVTVSSTELDDRLTSLTRELFVNHALIVQMNKDIFKAPIKPSTLLGLKTGYQCTDPVESTYIPPIAEGGVDDVPDSTATATPVDSTNSAQLEVGATGALSEACQPRNQLCAAGGAECCSGLMCEPAEKKKNRCTSNIFSPP